MIHCPFCEKPFPRSSPERFEACPGCGYRSARIETENGECLIIDSSLPDLITRSRKLMDDHDDLTVLIDRRVSHNQVAGMERRRHSPVR